MNIKAVLFDLDGTLLPMDQDEFVKTYFGYLAKFLAPHGYEPEKLIDAIWKGTAAMIRNTGEMTNEQAFWKTFCGIFGEDAAKDEPLFEGFYKTVFDKVQKVCGFTPEAARTVCRLKSQGLRVALATNPIFPAIATEKRIRWAGLEPKDFEHITTYENCRYSKPNTAYYEDILHILGLKAQECLMVGNDVSDDMVVQAIGMDVFLLTDCLINKEQKSLDNYPHGSFQQLLQYIEERQKA
ncbi:MAG: HAD family hydrolase [Oscillospiraceae bacterium]|nr:HAD family hydrolase [Oscillospiraceae bacterium]